MVFGSVNGAPMSDVEIQGAMTVLTLGGFGTSADATCNLAIAIAERPGLEDGLRDDSAALARTLEEVLRLEPPVTTVPRRCTQDSAFEGRVVHAGEPVLLNFAAANRDPAVFVDPEAFDPDRPGNRHFAFGGGVHRCLGSNLARSAVRIAIEELLVRVRGLHLAGPVERVSVVAATQRVVDHLPVEFSPADGGPR
jgi:cytochrome P450